MTWLPNRPDLVEKAEAIFAEAHTPDPKWPLIGRSEQHEIDSRSAWQTTRERRKAEWGPKKRQNLYTPE
jgi:hypothetical protein